MIAIGIAALIALVLGWLMMFVGGIWGLVIAFQDSITWGLICFLVPFASFFYIFKNWKKRGVRRSFFLGLTGFVLTILAGIGMGFLQAATLQADSTTWGEWTESADLGELSGELSSDDGWMLDENAVGIEIQPDFSQAEVIAAEPEVVSAAGENAAIAATLPPAVDPNQKYDYRQTMMVGYAAYQKSDYQTALINFRRALQARPNDRLALEAIQNTEAILQQRD
jgi:hypothetical protein